ncbi:unnamed protein product [Paramecium primaurelia]|uniref:Transmembrane protein n=2 Tax=Paramecium TaxID=5884 RepID=A0A8S1VHH4_9CILI|nr:unnamed protein product [Paramecium primaurelia]CAD8174196.1 unnamed protein product [Paramecium pentaurelia]
MILILILVNFIEGIIIKEVTDKNQTKKFHLDRATTIITMPGAADSILIGNQNDSYCWSQQPAVKTETKTMNIITEKDLTDYVYQEETPLNFGQFISMVHVRDGFIAITSNAKIYHLKFNYNYIHEIFSFPEYGNPYEFAGFRWKVDLQAYAPTTEDKEEIPQILYLKTNNLVLVLYPNSAQFFSMYEMDANSKHLILYTASSWKKRKERGLTKEYFGYVYSSVGREGIDVYRVSSYDVRFELTIDLIRLFPDFTKLSDFIVIKKDHDEFHMFMLDVVIGLIELAIEIDDGEFKYKVRPEIPRKEGGIAVDTKNGRNVFVVYKELFRYSIIEYLYDKNIEGYEIVNQHISYQKVVGLKVTDEFVLIQGLIHHQLIFSNSFKLVNPDTEPTIYTLFGVRNFMFFDQNITDYPLLKKFNITGFQYDDFFFGVTASGAFLVRYNFTPAGVKCYSNNETQILTQQSYLVKYNVTQFIDGEVNRDLVVRHNFYLNVQLSYPEPILEDELIKTLILVFVLLLVCLLALGCVEKVRQKNENEKFQSQPKTVEMMIQQNPFSKINQKLMSDDYKSKQERKKDKKKSQMQSQLI